MQNREKLIAFVKAQHGDQVRKYTNEPYFNHLLAVAEMAERTGVKYGWEIGLCHDLFEDTICTYGDLFGFLHSKLYDVTACNFICSHVWDLTDVFTSKDFPYLNRQIRKQCEALRLHTIDRVSQAVKCCDLIDNTSTIMKHDVGFAKKYIPEKREIVKGFTKIDGKIRELVWNCLWDAEEQLSPTAN